MNSYSEQVKTKVSPSYQLAETGRDIMSLIFCLSPIISLSTPPPASLYPSRLLSPHSVSFSLSLSLSLSRPNAPRHPLALVNPVTLTAGIKCFQICILTCSWALNARDHSFSPSDLQCHFCLCFLI